jgi:hypothetical protein
MSATDRAEQIERLKMLHNENLVREKKATPEDRRANTMLALAIADSEQPGRFGNMAKQTIVGATPEYQVPQLPANSPWNSWPEGPDVTGYDVDQMDPVGSEAEIEQAAQILRDREARKAAASTAAQGDAVVAAPSASSPISETTTASPTPTSPQPTATDASAPSAVSSLSADIGAGASTSCEPAFSAAQRETAAGSVRPLSSPLQQGSDSGRSPIRRRL